MTENQFYSNNQYQIYNGQSLTQIYGIIQDDYPFNLETQQLNQAQSCNCMEVDDQQINITFIKSTQQKSKCKQNKRRFLFKEVSQKNRSLDSKHLHSDRKKKTEILQENVFLSQFEVGIIENEKDCTKKYVSSQPKNQKKRTKHKGLYKKRIQENSTVNSNILHSNRIKSQEKKDNEQVVFITDGIINNY
ncbi:hypothetical protein TTHERM_00390220 (macronuclear) [Tetrahymena thermophila SB210]|uniref:Uncharacterized protein n=1 Tax=Tetrahymena thermophila (strain SB210) TaxID=312017 RepID=Q23R66_TETTS|nr:hypothetical protein TTHERM_00390220 [Tetrahymena thermophila SB210]EAR99182.1 hypothetical protein TTHERM_00390220 [Tetrahymena thermophila SB210]|eukprot:XP_001019427.1 hypothetical protein TTHERM_00390220 [Tetrahymena thermophila SB210]